MIRWIISDHGYLSVSRVTSTTFWNVQQAGSVFSTTSLCKHFTNYLSLYFNIGLLQNAEKALAAHCKQFWNASLTSEWIKYLVTIWFSKHSAHIIGGMKNIWISCKNENVDKRKKGSSEKGQTWGEGVGWPAWSGEVWQNTRLYNTGFLTFLNHKVFKCQNSGTKFIQENFLN